MPKINEILIEKLTNMWEIWTYILVLSWGTIDDRH